MAKRAAYTPKLPKAPEARYPSVIYQGEIVWVGGIPTLRNAPIRISSNPQDALLELVKLSLDLPYDGYDPSLAGLTNGEAMTISMARQAANGDATARQEIMDRILGRAQQNIKSVNISGDINELLDRVAAETRTMAIDAEGVPRPEEDL